jgi:PAS domain S-box-containing protein
MHSGTPGANRILIVHDDSAAAEALEVRLSEFGYTISGIVSPERAIEESINEARPQLVLMNLAPGVDVDRARRFCQRWSIPLVLLTETEERSVLDAAGIDGPFGYVVKPYHDRELLMNVQMALVRESARAEAHAREDRFFTVAIDMLCFLDFDGYFKRLNPAWERTLGFSRAELMSRRFIEFVHPDDRERTLNQNKAVRHGGQALGFENRYLCKDGSYRWFLWNAAPDSDRRLIYSVARDITDRKLAEQERERIVSELRAALAEVKTLQEILPICAYCKKIRDDEDYWQSVEGYISMHTNATFSHGICPTCYRNEVEPQFRGLDG